MSKAHLNRSLFATAVVALFALLMASCGGGGGGGDPSPPPTPVAPPAPPPITHTITPVQTSIDSVGYVNAGAQETFTWSFSSSGSASAQERYTLTSTPEGVEFGEGNFVSHGMTVETAVSYRCTEVGVVNFQIALTIVSSRTSRTFDWSVDCQLAPDDLIVLTAKFYQGVLLGVMRISQSPNGWFVDKQEHTWPDAEGSHLHTLSTNRRMFVEVELPRPYEFDTDITLRFPNLAEGETAERFRLETRRETVGEGEEQTDQFIHRVVYDVSRFEASSPNIMEIVIEPTPELPQLTSGNNVIRVNLTEFQDDVIPEMRLLILPVRTDVGVPDIDAVLEYGITVLKDVLPIAATTVRMGKEVDLTGVDALDMRDVLDAVREAGTEQAEFDEYVHGLVLSEGVPEKGQIAGIASLGGSVAVSSVNELYQDTASAFAGVFTHEIGHNLSLRHPREDPHSLHPDGRLGDEIGWRLSDRQRIKGSDPWTVNIMKQGGSVRNIDFITQQYYGIAKDRFIFWRTPISSSIPPTQTADFEIAEGRSFVLVGNLENGREWSVFHESAVDRTPFPREVNGHDFTIRILHLKSNTELYRSVLPVHEVVCGMDDEPAEWSVRLPAYRGNGLSAEILDRDGRMVFMHDLAKLEL